MDKETLSNYGWIVILVLILAVMIALATPFGNFIAGAIKSTTAGFFSVNQNALNNTGIPGVSIPGQEFEDTIGHNNEMSEDVNAGEIYTYGDYEYGYNIIWCSGCETWSNSCTCCEWAPEDTEIGGWSVRVIDSTKESYGPILSSVKGQPVLSLYSTFEHCENLKVAPELPNSIIRMDWTFADCWQLTTVPQIPSGVTSMCNTFHRCSMVISYSGSTSPDGDFSNYKIPTGLITAGGIFSGCVEIYKLPDFSNCNNLNCLESAFADCLSLTDLSDFIIPNGVTDMYNAFSGCTSITVKPTIPNSVQTAEEDIFFACPQQLSTSLNEQII